MYIAIGVITIQQPRRAANDSVAYSIFPTITDKTIIDIIVTIRTV